MRILFQIAARPVESIRVANLSNWFYREMRQIQKRRITLRDDFTSALPPGLSSTSYRRASSGFNLMAENAGKNPPNTPIASVNKML